jgi:Tetratricopeptide repeat
VESDPGRFQVDARDSRGVQVGDGNIQVNVFAAEPAVEWPVAVGVAPRAADAFQTRPLLEAAIRAFRRPGPSAGSGSTPTVVFVGDGGVGKTQLAAAVFREALSGDGSGGGDDAGVDLAVWVSAASRAAVLSSYAQAYTRTHPAAGADADRNALAFLDWLAATSRPWLIVLDDVADPADLARSWPAGPSGRVLLTTRRRDAAISGAGTLVEVGVFTVEQAAGYLTTKLASGPDLPARVLDEAPQLAVDLGYLPLALSHAAAVIVNDAITCAQYRIQLADQRERLEVVFPPETGHAGDDYAQTVAGTWTLARERANRLSPAGLAGPMLDLISMLDPNGIPEAVLTSPPVAAHLHPGGGVGAGAGTRRVLRNLWRLSLINHDPNDEFRSVRIHALAQRAAIEQLGPPAIASCVRTAADALIAIWPVNESASPLGQVLRANATVLAARDPGALWAPDRHELLFRLGHSLGETGLVGTAITHFATLVDEAVRRLGPDHPDTLRARADLAHWRGMAGDAAGTVTALQHVISDSLSVLGPHDPRTRAAQAELALWQGVMGDTASAVGTLEDLLAELLRTLGPDNPQTLTVRGNLGYVLAEGKQWAGAVAVLEKVLADQVRLSGPDQPETLVIRHRLSCYRGEAGDPAGAVAALNDLVSDRIRVLGPDHPETLATRHELARWRGEQGDPQAAVAALESLLPQMVLVLGSDHPWTMGSRHELARWRGEVGDGEGALETLEELLADRRRVLGDDHPWTMGTRNELARWRGETGDAPGAVALLKPLLADRMRVLGPDHPDTTVTRASLARWQQVQNDSAESAGTST